MDYARGKELPESRLKTGKLGRKGKINIQITIVAIKGDKVRVGIEAPIEVSVHRKEVYEAIKRRGEDGNP